MRITFRLPDKLGQDLKQTAANRGVSVSSLLVNAIEEYLTKQRRSHGKKALDLVGKVRVAADVQDMIKEDRKNDRT